MAHEVPWEGRQEVLLPPRESPTCHFHITQRSDERWQVEYSRGKHKRIFDRLIDATAGAINIAAADEVPFHILVERNRAEAFRGRIASAFLV